MTARSNAHVNPKSIGGKLSALFLCRGCNARMGRYEAILARDVTLRAILGQLEDQITATVVKSIRFRQNLRVPETRCRRIGVHHQGAYSGPPQSRTPSIVPLAERPSISTKGTQASPARRSPGLIS
jgi:hypothetical protein